MFFVFRRGMGGIPQFLMRFHDILMKETLKYFESGWPVRKKNREACKLINKALKIARKKQRNPGVMLGRAFRTIKGLNDEVEYTRKVMKATFDSMEEALNQIQKERIEDPAALIEQANIYFEKKNFKKANELLREFKEKSQKKALVKTRAAIFGGISGVINDLRWEMAERGKIGVASPQAKETVIRTSRPKSSDAAKGPHPEAEVFDFGSQSFATGVATLESEG